METILSTPTQKPNTHIMSSTNTTTETGRRKINIITEKYADVADRFLKLQIARVRVETKAAKFALFAASASDAERVRLSGYSEVARAEAAETAAELARAARDLIAIAGALEAYGLPADPEILRLASTTAAANH